MTLEKKASITLAIAVPTLLFAMVLLPSTFEQHDRFRLPIRFQGMKVVRYGFSRLHQQSFANYGDHSGDVIVGRTFVDVMSNDGRAQTYYGWKLRRTANKDQSRVDLRID